MQPLSERLDGLARIAARYDTLLCDVWGVLHNGVTAHVSAAQAIAEFSKSGATVLVTNAPRPSWPVEAQLTALGIPRTAYHEIVSSGDVVRGELAALGTATVYHLGPDRDLTLYEGLPITLAERADDTGVVIATGLRDDYSETPDDYRDEVTALARRGVRFICANPDVVVERGEDLLYCSGALAALFEDAGGAAEQYGKPHPPIYRVALERARTVGPASRVLVTGDGIPTDIRGACNEGFDALFVTHGIHTAELDGADAAAVTARLAADGLSARYHAPRLTW